MHFVDRKSNYPNRWTLKRADGSTEIVTLIRNDEPVIEGTPMNAETLNTLSDVAGADVAREAAEAAEANAKTSETNAKTSETNAKTSEENAKASEIAAKNSTGGYYKDFDLTIPTSAWSKATTKGATSFAYEATVAAEDCQSDMIPLGSVKPDSYDVARDAGIACICRTNDDSITFFSISQPTADINAQVSILSHTSYGGQWSGVPASAQATDEDIEELLTTYFGEEEES